MAIENPHEHRFKQENHLFQWSIFQPCLHRVIILVDSKPSHWKCLGFAEEALQPSDWWLPKWLGRLCPRRPWVLDLRRWQTAGTWRSGCGAQPVPRMPLWDGMVQIDGAGEVWPSGKRLHNYGKSPVLMGKLCIFMAIFNSKRLNCQMVTSSFRP